MTGPKPASVGRTRLIESRVQLAGLPTGTILVTGTGYVGLVHHGPRGQWTGGRTRIYPLAVQTDLVFYPANFDLSLPVAAWLPSTDYQPTIRPR
ncbi:hypothetical protein [Nocardia wallacei]|uniref:hypothetical protein n=1 Tax=Nocardia wallacei TaxID=480035 RepID=UPI0024544CEC|nr:hypothetical protein [Nocardia wallacei]